MSKVMDLILKAECCMLTACQSGRGKDIRGEVVMSMGRAFQYAGAQTVIASLWMVAEESSVRLTEHFFSHLKQGQNPLEAMRAARAEVRNTPLFQHPYFWAPFIVIGEIE